MDNAKTVSDRIADVVAQKAKTLFGLMGNGNAHFMASLTSRGFPVVTVRHETGSVIAAQAWHLSTGSIPVASVTYGAGFTNVLTSLAEARLARIPMVVVTGGAPTTGLRILDILQPDAARALYVRTLTVDTENAAAVTEAAFAIAARDRVPVIVEIPYDLVDHPVTVEAAYPVLPSEEVLRPAELEASPTPDPALVAMVADALTGAERPIIVGGRGVVLSGAGPALKAAGDKVGALFATSLMANGVFGSDWDLGLAGGFSKAEVAEVIGQADVVLVVGASLNLYQMRYHKLFASAKKIIQIDRLAAATHHLVTDYIRADAGAFAAALETHLNGSSREGWRSSITMPLAPRKNWEETGPDGRLDPRAVMDALEDILPKERTIVQDTGHFMGWAARHLSAPDPHGMLLPGLALHSIGLGVGAGLGIAVARPDRLAVMVTGDGGIAMELNEIDTLVRHVPSILVLVLNDAAYGMEVHQYGVRGLDTAAMVFPEMDFAKIGAAIGTKGARIETMADLSKIADWIEAGAQGVFIADVAISAEVVADWLKLSNAYFDSLKA